MPRKHFIANPCSRREFVLRSGLLVAGGLVACSGDVDKHIETNTDRSPAGNPLQNSVLMLPSTPVIVRVRIGKVRTDKDLIEVGDTSVMRARGKWSIHGNSPPRHFDDRTMVFESINNCLIRTQKKAKTISGSVTIHPRDDVSPDAFDVIAHIPLEQYVPGVLAGELYAHWHQETFAAQAVAARSYAVSEHLQRKNSSHYDVTDGPSSQMFIGNVDHKVARSATRETQGVVLSWNNTIVPAYYCACCGGIPALASDAISRSKQHNIPPLQGHSGIDPCTTLDIHRWSKDRNARIFRHRLNAYSKKARTPAFGEVRTIRAIEHGSTNVHGRPVELVIIDRQKNEVVVSAESLLRAANSSIVTIPEAKPKLWSSFFLGKKNGSTLQIDGVGMGHGVGLCQYGAQVLASRDGTWESILAWYYPNASLSVIPTTQ